jgi:hypothetical protein
VIRATRSRLLQQTPSNDSPDRVTFARWAGIEPDAWQVRALESEARRLIILAGRQIGKSTVTSLISLHTALYVPGSLVLVMAPALRQSGEWFLKLKQAHARLIRPPCGVVRETTTELVFAHGSRIVCLPGTEKSIRSFSDVAVLVLDEAALTEDSLYPSVAPMVARDGRTILLSTPRGARGVFHRLWTDGGDDWERIKVRAAEVPRRWPPEELARKRAEIGDWWYRQEFELEWMEGEHQIFAYDLVMAAVSAEVTPLFPIPDRSDVWASR